MANKRVAAALPLALIFALGAFFYALWFLDDHAGYRMALDHAGDGGLPGKLLESGAAAESRSALVGYRDFLRLDDGLVLLLALAFLSVAWLGRLRIPERPWPALLGAAAALYAASDWAENWMLRGALADALDGRQPALLAWAAAATWAKWLFFAVCLVLALLTLVRSLGRLGSWFQVLFLDMPALLDDLWRRFEFRFNRESGYDPERAALQPRRWWKKTPFWLYGLTVLFIAYGPTLDGLCSASPAAMEMLVWVPIAALLAWAVWVLKYRMLPAIKLRVDKRFEWLRRVPQAPHSLLDERAPIARLLLGVGAFLVVAPAIAAAITLGVGVYNRGWCNGVGFSGYSLARLGLWFVAIAAFAYACSRPMPAGRMLKCQALFVVAVALGAWLLSPAGANEASGDPYIHLFLIVAPAVCVLLCLAPRIAAWRLRKLRDGGARRRFSELLPQTELFVPAPTDPLPTVERVMHALTHGISERLLQLLLPPALLALAAPADWLPTFSAGGLVLAVLISTWANMSARWQHMAHDVQRWFLRGTALFVSLFVMALAAARILGIDYVTTILNAAPLGVVFGIVVMSYVLSWLVEYWINRVVAAELLELVGGEDGAVTMPYPRASAATGVDVKPTGRYLMVHGIGRFAVVGRIDSRAGEAFHSYRLLELFRALAGEKHRDVGDVTRQTDLYFHSFNLILVLLAAAAVLLYAYGPRYTAPAAMVQAQAAVQAETHFDLADRLLAAPGDARPALVVAASGGGTRAALYTAHVLEGLHRLGAARDIALMSGVSGGGVALAYFAANRDALVRASAKDKAWGEFRTHLADPFIEDVLEGVTELRVYRADSVSVLLSESFQRRLAKRGGRWSLDVSGAGLILNTAVAGHPDSESAVLAKNLDDADGGAAADCAERDRAYRLMAGGRLVFTNLKQTSKFPGRDNRIEDVRLPYVVVRDPAVSLATAAALNANFPPVFPNARVLLRGAAEAECPDRSYFVTDGGAQENLGLVSALYALQSALEEIKARCGGKAPASDPWCKRTLRPIRFVIAEASAATFDYEQDRGVSAAFSGKERLTGGLTEELIARNEALYRSSGVPAAAPKLEFHFLALPLAFRARGGFGTHWMHADRIELVDPRLRTVPGWLERGRAAATVTLERKHLDETWRALHNPEQPYCSRDYSYGNRHTDTVRRWICGSPGDKRGPRDLHIENWRRLLGAVGPPDPKRAI